MSTAEWSGEGYGRCLTIRYTPEEMAEKRQRRRDKRAYWIRRRRRIRDVISAIAREVLTT